MNTTIYMILNDLFVFIIRFKDTPKIEEMGTFIKFGNISRIPEEIGGRSNRCPEYIFRLDKKYIFNTFFREGTKLVIVCTNEENGEYVVFNTSDLMYLERKNEPISEIFKNTSEIVLENIIFDYFKLK